MSAKELGQIHTLNDEFTVNTTVVAPQVVRRIDLAGQLTDKLQKMVRQGNYFKLVGIDITCNPISPAGAGGGSVSGYIRYYNPTKGRCAAFRHAFKAMADAMKMQGIAMRNNKLYDFRVALSDQFTVLPLQKNLATLDGVNGLALNNATQPRAGVFNVYNKSVVPTATAAAAGDLFDEGFDTVMSAGTTDFVLNDTDIYSGNDDFADVSYDRIPFQISNDINSGAITTSFQWRPDPALFVAVLTGNMEIFVEDVNFTGGATSLEIQVATMVSGWKSIMGEPGKKKKSRRSRRKA